MLLFRPASLEVVETHPRCWILVVNLTRELGANVFIGRDLNRREKRHQFTLLRRREFLGFLLELSE